MPLAVIAFLASFATASVFASTEGSPELPKIPANFNACGDYLVAKAREHSIESDFALQGLRNNRNEIMEQAALRIHAALGLEPAIPLPYLPMFFRLTEPRETLSTALESDDPAMVIGKESKSVLDSRRQRRSDTFDAMVESLDEVGDSDGDFFTLFAEHLLVIREMLDPTSPVEQFAEAWRGLFSDIVGELTPRELTGKIESHALTMPHRTPTALAALETRDAGIALVTLRNWQQPPEGFLKYLDDVFITQGIPLVLIASPGAPITPEFLARGTDFRVMSKGQIFCALNRIHPGTLHLVTNDLTQAGNALGIGAFYHAEKNFESNPALELQWIVHTSFQDVQLEEKRRRLSDILADREPDEEVLTAIEGMAAEMACRGWRVAEEDSTYRLKAVKVSQPLENLGGLPLRVSHRFHQDSPPDGKSPPLTVSFVQPR